MAPLRILLLLIDKPGHRHQAEGLAHVMGRMRDTEVDRLEVKPRWFVPPALRQLGVRRLRSIAPAFWLKHLYGIDVDELEKPDVIVGSGRPAVAVGLLLKRHFDVPYVYSGLARGLSTASEIDLLLVNEKDFAATRPNAVLTPVPCLVEPDRLPRPREFTSLADLDGATIGVLLGGDAHSHDFGEADWDDIVRLVVELRARRGLRVSVANSRRTGDAPSDRFAALAGEGRLERFVDWRVSGSGSIGDIFATDALIVTEDSISMMSEAVAAQRRVIALRPRVFDTSLDAVVGTLVDTGAMAVMDIAGANADTVAATLLRLAPTATDHRDEIAAALTARLPGLFAGTEAAR
jgi:mitochondrial fission protein ELM1